MGTETQTETIQDFIARNRLTMTATQIDSRPDGMEWFPGTTHWKCRIASTAPDAVVALETLFSQGSAFTEPPTLSDVLDCLASDAAGAEQDFDDWCSDLGYDNDSRKAYRTWKAVRVERDKLVALLGEDELEHLLYQMERL